MIYPDSLLGAQMRVFIVIHPRRLFALLGISLFSLALAGSPPVYKCKDDNGTTVYQAYPCSDAESEKVRIDPEPSARGSFYYRAEPPESGEDEKDREEAEGALEKSASDSDKRTQARAECVSETARYDRNIQLQNFALKLCQGGLSAAAMHECMKEGQKKKFTLDGWQLHVQNCRIRGGPSR